MQYYHPRGSGNLVFSALEVAVGVSLVTLVHYKILPEYVTQIGVGFALYPIAKVLLFDLIAESVRRGVAMANFDVEIHDEQEAGERAAAEEAQGNPQSPWRGTLNAETFASRAGGK